MTGGVLQGSPFYALSSRPSVAAGSGACERRGWGGLFSVLRICGGRLTPSEVSGVCALRTVVSSRQIAPFIFMKRPSLSLQLASSWSLFCPTPRTSTSCAHRCLGVRFLPSRRFRPLLSLCLKCFWCGQVCVGSCFFKNIFSEKPCLSTGVLIPFIFRGVT